MWARMDTPPITGPAVSKSEMPERALGRIENQKGNQMQNVTIALKGLMPLLMHADNIEWADQMDEWKNNPDNKSKSKAGDDRTPVWRWMGALNHDGNVITIPSENIMACIMQGAAQVLTGQGKKTFKAQSQSGLLCTDFHWPLVLNGQSAVAMSDVEALRTKKTFSEQVEGVRALGFDLFIKRVKIGMAKHIRVRPRFDQWAAKGQITIMDEAITPKILQTILDIAGKYKGLGDWRPGGKTPGPWGMFEAKVSE